jgi:hypothetical protein
MLDRLQISRSLLRKANLPPDDWKREAKRERGDVQAGRQRSPGFKRGQVTKHPRVADAVSIPVKHARPCFLGFLPASAWSRPRQRWIRYCVATSENESAVGQLLSVRANNA